jgi:hypothetical protein
MIITQLENALFLKIKFKKTTNYYVIKKKGK